MAEEVNRTRRVAVWVRDGEPEVKTLTQMSADGQSKTDICTTYVRSRRWVAWAKRLHCHSTDGDYALATGEYLVISDDREFLMQVDQIGASNSRTEYENLQGDTFKPPDDLIMWDAYETEPGDVEYLDEQPD